MSAPKEQDITLRDLMDSLSMIYGEEIIWDILVNLRKRIGQYGGLN